MNETKTKTVIETWPVRECEAVKVWRETTVRQCTQVYMSAGAFCAIGVLAGSINAVFSAMAKYGITDAASSEQAPCPRCGKERRTSYQMLTHWNDDHRLSFKEIADLAEAYPHLVFTEAQS